jgi:phage terminase large subunit-like protein
MTPKRPKNPNDLALTRMRAYPTDIVAFIDDTVKKTEEGRPFRLLEHQRRILGRAFAFGADGKLPYTTIVWSEIKKSGKTAINAVVVLWWAITQEAPNEILLLANDQEQSMGRVFKACTDLIKQNPALRAAVAPRGITAREIRFKNGTTVKALPKDYVGSAGSKHGLTSWDELWGYSQERATRLWEEMTPVAIRRNSIRFISTYAGFENESELLWRLYLQGVGTEEHPEGQGTRIDPDLPVYVNDKAKIFCYWSHESRMPWQLGAEGEAYYASERETLRPITFQRLHENRWSASETSFITEAMYRQCVDPATSPLLAVQGRRSEVQLYVGVDVGVKRDSSAVVAVRVETDPETKVMKIVLARHRIWRPTRDEQVDIEQMVEAHLLELHQTHRVREILVDPSQMLGSIQRLRAKGLAIKEYTQTPEHLTEMGTQLYDLFKNRHLRVYEGADDLRAHVLNAVVVESVRGIKLAKEKASKKIDAAVALSMACVSAVLRPQSWGVLPVMAWTRHLDGTVTISHGAEIRPKPTVSPMDQPVLGYSERGDMPRPRDGKVSNTQGRIEPARLHPHGNDTGEKVGVQCLACGAAWETVTDPIAREHSFFSHWGVPHSKHADMPPEGQRYKILQRKPTGPVVHDQNDPIHRNDCAACRKKWEAA